MMAKLYSQHTFTYADKLNSGEKIISLEFNSKNELFAGLNGSKKNYKNITRFRCNGINIFSPGAGGADTRGLTIDTNDVIYTADD